MNTPTDDVRILLAHDYAEQDVHALRTLIAQTTELDGHRPIGEHALVELKRGTKVFPHAAFAAWQGETLVGYAHLSERETRSGWRLEAFVHPSARGHGIGTRLVQTALNHVQQHKGGHIHLWAYRPSTPQERMAQRFDLSITRKLLRMHRDLPIVADQTLPQGIRIRPFELKDVDRWIEAHNLVFAEHPDAGNWGRADLEWHIEEPWYDPSGFLIAEDGEGIAGYCWMKLEDGVGWVFFLGVHPRYRGKGLAQPLCVRGLSWAASGGANTAALYVDSDNTSAVRLYERMGFAFNHIDLCYETTLTPSQE